MCEFILMIKIYVQLKNSKRIISETIKLTLTKWLPVLCNILPLSSALKEWVPLQPHVRKFHAKSDQNIYQTHSFHYIKNKEPEFQVKI